MKFGFLISLFKVTFLKVRGVKGIKVSVFVSSDLITRGSSGLSEGSKKVRSR